MRRVIDPIAIIGAGIGGLTCAAALRRAGLPVRVFERAPALGEVGAGLGLWTSAVRALQGLGIGADLWARSVPMRRGEMATSSGRVLHRTDVGAITDALGAPSYILHRADLHAAIAAAVPADAVTLDAACIGVDTDPAGATAHFARHPSVRAPLVIGADGLNSVVRAALWGAEAPRYSGETCYRGVARFAVADLHTLREVQGPAQRASVCVLDRERVYWWAAFPAPAGGSAPPEEEHRRLRERYRGWPFGIPEAIDATPTHAILRNDLCDRPPRSPWSRGRVTLLGDAAHPTTPNLGQGAVMAIEDAVVLARALATHDDLGTALGAYERERMPRSARIVTLSLRFGQIAQWRHPLAVRLRELAASHVPPSVIERTLRDQIAYDAGAVTPGAQPAWL